MIRDTGRAQCVDTFDPCNTVPSCQVAEHCWDPVRLAIVEYAYRFERLRASAQGGG